MPWEPWLLEAPKLTVVRKDFQVPCRALQKIARDATSFDTKDWGREREGRCGGRGESKKDRRSREMVWEEIR